MPPVEYWRYAYIPDPPPSLPNSVQPGDPVIYTGTDKFGFDNEHTGTLFRLVSRTWDQPMGGDGQYLYTIRNNWGEERENVSARDLKLAYSTTAPLDEATS